MESRGAEPSKTHRAVEVWLLKWMILRRGREIADVLPTKTLGHIKKLKASIDSRRIQRFGLHR